MSELINVEQNCPLWRESEPAKLLGLVQLEKVRSESSRNPRLVPLARDPCLEHSHFSKLEIFFHSNSKFLCCWSLIYPDWNPKNFRSGFQHAQQQDCSNFQYFVNPTKFCWGPSSNKLIFKVSQNDSIKMNFIDKNRTIRQNKQK
jgi:hypothetical protein